jgi:hypothetical protein
MRSRHSKPLNCSIGKRKNDVAWGDFAHSFVKWIYLIVSLPLWRPDVFPEKFMPEGLAMIDPPEVHFLPIAANRWNFRSSNSFSSRFKSAIHSVNGLSPGFDLYLPRNE